MGPKNWLLGIIPLLIIWVVTNIFMTGWVEQDLTARASAAISAPGSNLDKPSLTVAGRDVTIAGTAFDAKDDAGAVKAADSTNGVRLVRDAITAIPSAKPYLFDAKLDGKTVVLTGNVPQPTTRSKIIAAAKLAAPGASVVDNMTYAQGAPAGFETIVAYGIAEAGKLENSDVSLLDTAYSISGFAPTAPVFDAAMAATQQLPAGATLAKAEITQPKIAPKPVEVVPPPAPPPPPPPPPAVVEAKADTGPLTPAECQPKFADSLAKHEILFDSDKASIHKDSDAILNELSVIAKRCPDAKIQISGHTDASGKVDKNMKLSKLRANAVVDYLVKSGIPRERLTAVGYGQTRPLASNDTVEGRAQNRRIEFEVK